MSESVANALRQQGDDDLKETAEFVEKFNQFFDCLNVSSLSGGKQKRKKNRYPYRTSSDDRLKVYTVNFTYNGFADYSPTRMYTLENLHGTCTPGIPYKYMFLKCKYPGTCKYYDQEYYVKLTVHVTSMYAYRILMYNMYTMYMLIYNYLLVVRRRLHWLPPKMGAECTSKSRLHPKREKYDAFEQGDN